MRWLKKRDLSLSNEYQDLTRGGCINCGALREVLRSVKTYNLGALSEVLSVSPLSDDHMDGCWAYNERSDDSPCLAKLKDDDPKVIQARDEIIRARQAIGEAEVQHNKERARRLREVKKRRLP
jgi:hypothetical protein